MERAGVNRALFLRALSQALSTDTSQSLYWPPANLWPAGHQCSRSRAHKSLHWPLGSCKPKEPGQALPTSLAHRLPSAPVRFSRILPLPHSPFHLPPASPSPSTAWTGTFSCSGRLTEHSLMVSRLQYKFPPGQQECGLELCHWGVLLLLFEVLAFNRFCHKVSVSFIYQKYY